METSQTAPARIPNVAASAAAEAGGDAQSQYLTFMLGDEMFAIRIAGIREILEYGQATAVPMAPPFIRGVLNLRGSVLPIIDLAIRFGRSSREQTKRTCVVVVEVAGPNGRQPIGIRVDAVNEVLDIAPGDIEPAPEFGARLRSYFVLGLGKVEDRFVVILDPERVLSLEEISVAGAVAARA
jgi:purine-binding chemotaxis protein CheW